MKNPSIPYRILPFRFLRYNERELLLVNDVGEFIFSDVNNFERLITYDLDSGCQFFLDLKGKHFLTDTNIEPVVDLLATKYRTKKAFLKNFTALHMVVVTLRCNQRCRYCHASSEHPSGLEWDMKRSTAHKVVETIFKSPSPTIKIEFQGGEPLLNWETVVEIIEYAEKLNRTERKDLEFVLCTNLTLMTEDMLAYIKKHNMIISTSLDGPPGLHNSNRVFRSGGGTYDLFVKKLEMARDSLGVNKISALMTATKGCLSRIKEVVDEYVKRGFQGIFLRALNPYGFARGEIESLGFSTKDFVTAYKDAIQYIIGINLRGTYFEEFYTTLLLTRMLTPFSTGFMDLQSPAGAGISGAVYDFNGDVYPTDEARMLAKMGNHAFRLGNVMTDSYASMFGGRKLRSLIGRSVMEILPGCHSCAFQIYCGADPIRNYTAQGDVIGHRPTSDFCKKNREIIRFLFELVRSDQEEIMDVFWSWITKRKLEEIRCVELSRYTD